MEFNLILPAVLFTQLVYSLEFFLPILESNVCIKPVPMYLIFRCLTSCTKFLSYTSHFSTSDKHFYLYIWQVHGQYFVTQTAYDTLYFFITVCYGFFWGPVKMDYNGHHFWVLLHVAILDWAKLVGLLQIYWVMSKESLRTPGVGDF